VKKDATIIILTVTVAVLSLSFLNLATVRASPSYSIEAVNHTISILYNGYVVINDTITISGQTNSFLMGFPHSFGPNVVSVIAYETDDSSSVFPVTLNVPLENRIGFYGVEVDFRAHPSGAPQTFSIVSVLSNNLLTPSSASSTFTLVFPAFPSFNETVPVCNCSVLMSGAQYVSGTVSGFTYSAENLSAFTYNTSQITFSVPEENLQIFEVKQLSRQVSINEFGGLSVSDKYYIANNSPDTMDFTEVVVPPNASNLKAYDQIGLSSVQPTLLGTDPTRYMINFTLNVQPNETVRFAVSYDMPNDLYVKKQTASDFTVNMSFFQDTNYYIDQASVTFILPVGARLSSYGTDSSSSSYDVNRGIFQETFTVDQQDIISLNSFAVSVDYGYNPLWLAFLPTMWVWAAAIAGTLVAIVWKRPKAPMKVTTPSTTLRLRPQDIRSFTDAYDEKMKLESEIDVLEARVQKGKIPRRRYKVQKKTLETSLSTLDRSLAELGGKMHSAGGHYSDLMRQLEVAETEIDEVEANMKSIEGRLDRAEISLETYRKLQGDYEHRRDRARTTINGILLRLREETH
jgi:hypothetical protein